MSDDKPSPDNVINLADRSIQIEGDARNEYLKMNRDELLEALDSFKGQVMSFDLTGLVIIGIAKHQSEDVTYASHSTEFEQLRVVGALEFMKTAIIYERIQDLEDQDFD